MNLSTVRALLGILGGASFGYLIAVIVLGLATPRDVSVSVAVTAACVIGIGLVRAIERDRREWIRRGREEAWARREREEARRLRREMPEAWPYADLKPWPVGDDEEQQ